MNRDLNITHKQFIEKYNQAINTMLPLPSTFRFFLRRGTITLRKKLYIHEVEGPEQFKDDEGLNITISNADLYLFFVVTINQATKKLTKVALNCKLDNFNQDKMIIMFTAIKAVVSTLEGNHIEAGKESKDLLDNLGITDINAEEKYHFRNGIAYKKIISKDIGFCFTAEPDREGLLDKIANDADYSDFNEKDLLVALKSDTERVKKQHQEMIEEWEQLSNK